MSIILLIAGAVIGSVFYKLINGGLLSGTDIKILHTMGFTNAQIQSYPGITYTATAVNLMGVAP
jgi:hypothetical protein